jgi:hypothetical protein
MIVVPLTWAEVFGAAVIGLLRYVKACQAKRHNFSRKNKGIFGHVLSAIAERAMAKHLGIYWVASTDPDKATGDVCGFEIRATQWPEGHLRVSERDPDDRLCVLMISEPGEEICWRIVGMKRAGECHHDEWWHAQYDEWWVPQEALDAFSRAGR